MTDTAGAPEARPPRILVFGHRGCGPGPEENTIRSFERALQLGADGVEFDVRRTADGALVVHHDPVVAGLGPLHLLQSSQLPSRIPLLEAALAACRSGVVNIEVKNAADEPGFDPTERLGRDVGRLVESWSAAARASDEASEDAGLIVSSFATSTLDAVLSAAGGAPTGLLLAPDSDLREGLALAVAHGYSAVHPWYTSVHSGFVESAHQARVNVHVWTVDTFNAVAEMVAARVDAIITNRIVVVRTAIETLTSA